MSSNAFSIRKEDDARLTEDRDGKEQDEKEDDLESQREPPVEGI